MVIATDIGRLNSSSISNTDGAGVSGSVAFSKSGRRVPGFGGKGGGTSLSLLSIGGGLLSSGSSFISSSENICEGRRTTSYTMFRPFITS